MSRRPISVMVTGAGAPGIAGTIAALRMNPDGVPVRIVAVDMDEAASGRFMADAFYVVPRADDPRFIPALMEIARKERVDVILPQVTRELQVLADHHHSFESMGVRIAVSAPSVIRRSNDKLSVLMAARTAGVPYPEWYVAASEAELVNAAVALGYPTFKVVVKPRVSNGMRGLRILSSAGWDVRRFLEEKPEGLDLTLDELIGILRRGRWPELLVTEYLPGPEYTVDVFRGQLVTVAIPRVRQKVRGGITVVCQTEVRADLINYSIQLAEELGLRYCFGFQFKLTDDGVPKILECNPRVQGTMVAGVAAGFNFIYYAVREALGTLVEEPSPDSFRDKLQFVRYWGGIAVHEETGFRARI